MRQITISLPDDIAHSIEIRAAIDDLTLAQGIEAYLVDVTEAYNVGRL